MSGYASPSCSQMSQRISHRFPMSPASCRDSVTRFRISVIPSLFSFCLLFVASPITIFSPRISSLPLSSSAGLCRSKRSLFYGSFSSAWNFVPGRATGLAIRASKCNKGCVYYTISPIIPKSNPKCQAMCRQSGEPMRTYKILIRITISWPLRTKLNISQ